MVQKINIKIVIAIITLMFGFAVALPAYAHGDSTATSTPKAAMKLKKGKKSVDATCMQSAVDTRESALISAFSGFHDDIEEGLNARKTALNSAWGLSAGNERGKALRDAWKAWKTAHKDAFKTFRDARKSAWDTFKGTVKSTCKETLPAEETLTTDSAGSVSI